jgi:hypothetical protein
MRGKALGNIVSGKCAAEILGAFCLVAACANTLWAQSDPEPLRTFTAPDAAFSFRYWDHLIRCKKIPEVWAPDECSAYHPTCDDLADLTGKRQTSIACFAYPKNKFTDTKAFEAATFSVEVVDEHATAKSCLAGPEAEGLDVDKHGTTRIQGVSFAAFEFGEGGMNQGVDVELYRTFHNGKCYQLGINRASANATVFDPPERDLTDADEREVNGTLKQALKSFRFLK